MRQLPLPDLGRGHAQAEVDFQTPPWPKISPTAKDCVRQLLSVNAADRPTASQLLQVPHLLSASSLSVACSGMWSLPIMLCSIPVPL